MSDRDVSQGRVNEAAWERAWIERYPEPERRRGGQPRRDAHSSPRTRLASALLAAAVLGVLISSIAIADSGDGDATDVRQAGGAARVGDPITLGERNPRSGGSSKETSIVANAGNGGLVLRPSNTAKGGRAVSATCDNDGATEEDGCAVYVNKGQGAAATFRTNGSVPFAIRETNNGLVQHLNSDMVDGKQATDFLGATAKAADSDKLDGKDSTAFLDSNAKAADANTLDGKDSGEFLGSTAKAADSNTLDGRDSQGFARFAGNVSSTGVGSGSGFTSSRLTTGQYFVSFPAGTFPPNPNASCTVPIAVATPTTGSLRFAAVAGSQCSADGSGGFTVETYDNDAAYTQVDTPFNFIAY